MAVFGPSSPHRGVRFEVSGYPSSAQTRQSCCPPSAEAKPGDQLPVNRTLSGGAVTVGSGGSIIDFVRFIPTQCVRSSP